MAETRNLCFNWNVMKALTLIGVTLAACIAVLHAEIVPTLSTKELAESADLIIVGKVGPVDHTGAGTINLHGVSYPREDYRAEIRVDEIIKGEPVPSTFILSYSTPSTDKWGNVAKGGLPPNTYRIVFLVKTSSGYEFASPYYASIPASPKPCGPGWNVNLGEDAYQKVQQRVLSILCTDSSIEEKSLALWSVNWNPDPSAAPFLEATLALPQIKSSASLRTTILSDLLNWKEVSVLPLVEDELFQPSLHTEAYQKSNLLLAISRLDPQVSVPLLAHALKLPESEARAGAARALEYTNSESAVDALLTALDDPDRDVQTQVMQALGNLTHQHQWRPGSPDSDPNWMACVEHWREFETQRKTPPH